MLHLVLCAVLSGVHALAAGKGVIRTVGSEIDRLEGELRELAPGLSYVDLETDKGSSGGGGGGPSAMGGSWEGGGGHMAASSEEEEEGGAINLAEHLHEVRRMYGSSSSDTISGKPFSEN